MKVLEAVDMDQTSRVGGLSKNLVKDGSLKNINIKGGGEGGWKYTGC